ncbi:hypothetical protein [Pseudochrobactrum sp. B5]|uniref:2-keto-4-pentenoate hydratase n=1 Tax=Pseudochrobactrum sp. B5 TaxID=1289478 RepID=UPI000951C675|nr:hypothetical protein [Pseudochrobactrum sp. B5]
MTIDINALADRLIEARRNSAPLETLTEPGETKALDDAVRVAQEVVRKEVQSGDRVIGFKLGNIAKAMQDKFGVAEPDFGYLLSSQLLFEGMRVAPERFIAPFVELEPAFVLKSELGGADVNVLDVIAATDYVIPALEIIDSRVKDWKIDSFETTADGGSVGAVVLSAQPRQIGELNLGNIAGEILIDGVPVAQGNTSALAGHPVQAIAWLCRRIAEYGITFKKGDVILAGSVLAAVEMTPGTRITGRFEGWGEIGFSYGDV